MATTLQLRRYTTAELSSITGADGELLIDTSKKTVTVQDGSTAGGSPLATETFVTSAITGYGAGVSTLLLGYATNANLTATLVSYTLNTNLTSTLSNYTTNANLTSTLNSYTLNANLTSTLTNYPTNANLTSTVNTAISNLVGGAPAILDTLSEIATALNNDSSLAVRLTSSISNLSSTLTSSIVFLSSNLSTLSSTVAGLGTGGGGGSISPLSLGTEFAFISGASTATYTSSNFSSAFIAADLSSISISNAITSTLTSILALTTGTTLLVYSSSSGVAIPLVIADTPTSSVGSETIYNSGYAYPSYTLHGFYGFVSSGAVTATHYIFVMRSAYPQFQILNEGSDFTYDGLNSVTISTTVTDVTHWELKGTSAPTVTVPVYVPAGSPLITPANNPAGVYLTQISPLTSGATTTSVYTGSQGQLVNTNPNGVRYYADGTIEYPNGLTVDVNGSILIPAGGSIFDSNYNTVINPTSSYATQTYVNDYVSSALVGYTPGGGGGGTTSATTYGALTSATISAGALTLDYSSTVVLVQHDQDITSITVVNGPTTSQAATITVILTQDSTTGNNIVTGGFITTNGAGFNLDLTTGATNVVTFLATNISGSTTLYGFVNSTGAI